MFLLLNKFLFLFYSICWYCGFSRLFVNIFIFNLFQILENTDLLKE
jgi:hypothetical protein